MLVVALFITGMPNAFCAPAGWVLHQKSAWMGYQTVYVTPAKMLFKSNLFNGLLDVNTEQVTVYNETSKQYCKLPLSEWRKRISSDILVDFGDVFENANQEASIAGQQTQLYRMYTKSSAGKKELSGQLWAAPDMGLPARARKAIAQIVGMPDQFGVPLRVYRLAEGRKVPAIDTLKIERKNLPGSLFVLPKGFTEAEDEVSLFLGGSGDAEGLSGLFGELDGMDLDSLTPKGGGKRSGVKKIRKKVGAGRKK